MIDILFRFPIIMVDGGQEDTKMKLGIGEEDIDIIYGYAECPFYDFLSVCDRWLPSPESYQDALEGKFGACGVTFGQCGTYVVPWTREKFKKELKKFIDALPEETAEVHKSGS